MTGANRTGGPPVGSWSGFRCGRDSVVSSKYLQSEELDVISTGGRLGSVTWLLPANRRCSWADSWVTLCVCPQNKDEPGGEGGGGLGQRYPLAWYLVESEPAAHRCYRICSLALYSLSLPLPPPSPSTTHLLTHTILSHCNSCRSSAVFPGETN